MTRFIEKIWEPCPACNGHRLNVYKGAFVRCNNYKCQWTVSSVDFLADKLRTSGKAAAKFLNDYQSLIDSDYQPALDKMYHYDSAFVRTLDDYQVVRWHWFTAEINGFRYLKHIAAVYGKPVGLIYKVLNLDVSHVTAVQWTDVLREMRRRKDGGFFDMAA